MIFCPVSCISISESVSAKCDSFVFVKILTKDGLERDNQGMGCAFALANWTQPSGLSLIFLSQSSLTKVLKKERYEVYGS